MGAEKQVDRPQMRPYRSKRHRPCDVCRRRKHGCSVDQQLPCRACRQLGIECSFNDAPRKRGSNGGSSTATSYSRDDEVGRLLSPAPTSRSSLRISQMLDGATIDQEETVEDEASGEQDDTNVDYRTTVLPTMTGVTSFQNVSNDRDAQGLSLLPSLSPDDFWLPASSLLDPSFGLFPPLSEEELNISAGLDDGISGSIEDYPHASTSGAPGHLRLESRAQTIPHSHRDDGIAGVGRRIQNAEPIRPVRALDDFGSDTTARYSILAGEVDPSLLRHMRFKDEDNCDFGQFRFRTVSNNARKQTTEPIAIADSHQPVHFLISNTSATSSSPSCSANGEREELYQLVPPELGARLIGLFLRYIFPSLPLLSRTNLHIKSETMIPPVDKLNSLHPGLLAAVYALAGSYRRYDPVLCVTQAESVFPSEALWQLASNAISRELHTSQMHVLQTIILYLQRSVDDTTATTTDTPGDWPLLGSAVNITKHLGLHLDCDDWPIPHWERRLRRRVWWIVHSEATFRGILRGLPRLFHADDWSVSPLEDVDFKMERGQAEEDEIMRHEQAPNQSSSCPYCHFGYDFKYLASLSIIAYDINHSLHSVAAVKRLGTDLSATVTAVLPLLRRLEDWKADLPSQLSFGGTGDVCSRPYFHSGSAAHLKLAFVTLEVLVQRALLRPQQGALDATVTTVGWPMGTEHSEPSYRFRPAESFSRTGSQEWSFDETRSCLDLAKRALVFTQGLSSYDRNSFAYSWASACFATISNFILLLVVQAPTAKATRESLTVLVRWIMILRDQAVTFAFIRLGLLRLDSVLWVGLENAFHFPAHVRQTLQTEHLSGSMNSGTRNSVR